MRSKDPDTHKPETVQKYFDRVHQIANEAANYPTMKVPIAIPLLKVFALEGLLRSDKKYEPMVTMAYSNNLADSFESIADKMTTVEGMRGDKIRDQYGSLPTNLATADVQTARSASASSSTKNRKGNQQRNRSKQKPPFLTNPDGPCHLPNHYHKNRDCSVQKLRHLKATKRASAPLFGRDGKRICDFKANGINCPFAGKCNQSHWLKGASTVKVCREVDRSYSSDESRRSSRSSRSSRSRSKASRHNKNASTSVAIAAAIKRTRTALRPTTPRPHPLRIFKQGDLTSETKDQATRKVHTHQASS